MLKKVKNKMSKLLFILIILSPMFAHDQIPGQIQKRPILLKGGIIHTVSGEILKGYDLLFSKGKIISVEKSLLSSPETDVYEVFGKHIVPGYVSPVTRLGLVEIGLVKQTHDFSEIGEINPNVKANLSYNPDSELIPVTRSNGVLIANSVPSSGRISGQSSTMMLDGWTFEDATLKSSTGLHINWPNMNIQKKSKRTKAQQRQSQDSTLRELDFLIQDVKAYSQSRKLSQRTSTNIQKTNLKLESMSPFILDKKMIFIHAHGLIEIESAVSWANKHNLKITIIGGHDTGYLTELLIKNNIPVVIQHPEWWATRRHEPIHYLYKLPLLLNTKGVQFCLATKTGYPYDGNIRNLQEEALRAIKYGLTSAEALRSITLSAAEILGVDDKVGSIDIGKDATFFISDLEPMNIKSKILKAYIQGKLVDLNDRQKMLKEKYEERYKRMGRLIP